MADNIPYCSKRLDGQIEQSEDNINYRITRDLRSGSKVAHIILLFFSIFFCNTVLEGNQDGLVTTLILLRWEVLLIPCASCNKYIFSRSHGKVRNRVMDSVTLLQ